MSLHVIEEKASNMRLDQALCHTFPDHSRAYFQSLIERKAVQVNGKMLKKRERVTAGDTIEIEFLEDLPLAAKAEDIPLKILYEDPAILVVNKPVGMVVHPAPGAPNGTLVNAVLHHLGNIETCDDPLRPGIVHRLDKDTSGVIVIAKNRRVHQNIAEQFANRTVLKEYLAVTISRPQQMHMTSSIGRHPVNRQKMTLLDEGRQSETIFEIEKQKGDLFLIRARPRTGRTHQIRVHAKASGAPILGDPLYGSTAANKKYRETTQLLHSQSLTITHPVTGDPITFKTPVPARFSKYF